MSKIGSIILKIKLYQNYWINRKLLNGHFYNPLLVVKKWALFLSAHMQLSSSQFKSWLCSTVLNNCGHTYIVSYYHNNSPYGTHTKTQKRIPLSLKHNFPTHNVTKLFHKSFLKSCVSMISQNFYSSRISEVLNISEKGTPVAMELFWNSSRIQLPSARRHNFDWRRWQISKVLFWSCISFCCNNYVGIFSISPVEILSEKQKAVKLFKNSKRSFIQLWNTHKQ